MNNTADINYFKNPPFDTKFGETAFKEKLPSILESHENEINNLETDKLEKNGYSGTAQDLKNLIDSAFINMFNYLTVTNGKYLDINTGNLINNALWFTSDYIKVTTSLKYKINYPVFVCFYTESNVFISGINASNGEFTTPSNCGYIRFSGNTDGQTIQQYIIKPFDLYNDKLIIDESNLSEKSAIMIGYKSKNIFDKSNVINGKYLDINTGNLLDNVLWCTSNFIKVEKSSRYNSNYGIFICFYDFEKNFISGANATNGIINTPSTCEYIKVSCVIADTLNILQIELGSVSTAYETYNKKIRKEQILNMGDYIEITLTVRIGGTPGVNCEFNNIKSALDSIMNSSYYKRYIIYLLNGTYDISNDGNNYLGFKNYARILGQSRNGVKIIKRDTIFSSSKAGFDPAYYGNTIDYASIENVTIITHNCKSPIHADTSSWGNGVIEIINCDLINENSGTIHDQLSVATGLWNTQTFRCINCTGNGQMYSHNAIMKTDMSDKTMFVLDNCIMPHTEIGDIYCTGVDNYIIKNCKMKYIKVSLSNPVNYPILADYKYAYDIILENNDVEYVFGWIYDGNGLSSSTDLWTYFGGKFGVHEKNIHNYVKNKSGITLNKGDLVSINNWLEVGVEKWSVGKKLYGVMLDTLENEDFGTVQYKGVVEIQANATTPINFMDELELNSSGNVVKRTTGTLIGYAIDSLATGTAKIKVKLA